MEKRNFLSNFEVAKLLKNVSAAYQIKKGNRFKIIAYERAAAVVEQSTTEIKDLWENNRLDELSGIGQSIEKHLDELFRTGKVNHFNKVFQGLPPAMFEFLSISGIGPKKAYKLAVNLKITEKSKALQKLRKAASMGKIRRIESFGKDSEKEILDNMQQLDSRQDRMRLSEALRYSEKMINYMKKSKYISEIHSLGSLRRRSATVGDIDIAAASENSKEAIDWFDKYPGKKKLVESGVNKATILMENNVQVDFRVESPNSYGSLLQHFTGSKAHNITLREFALKKELSLSEHGIKKLKAQGSRLKAYKTEKEFYKALGMQWIPPELRENTGEIEAALNNKLPKLVKLSEIKGDLHIHSDFDIQTSRDIGVSSIKEICLEAMALGYEYIALSEHNPSMSKHSDQEVFNLLIKKKKAIEQIYYSLGRTNKLFIFNSLEIDILPDGSRAISDRALEVLDFGIVSIHSSFRQSSDDNTRRILKALDHPKVKILGHPTGRMINKRREIQADWRRIFEFCRTRNKILEINANPTRLDLPDTLVKEALKIGVKLVINADSHDKDSMTMMKYGVWTARRGWATKTNIINTLNCDKIKKILLN